MKLLLPGLLLTLCLGLAMAICFELAAPAQTLDDPAAAEKPRSHILRPPIVYVPPSASAYDVINARAVFDPARMAVTEPVAEGGAQAPPDLVLEGVVIGPGKSVALLGRKSEVPAISVAVGQVVDGWTLARIEPDKVVFRGGGSEAEIPLRSGADPGAQAQQAPPRPSPILPIPLPAPAPAPVSGSMPAPNPPRAAGIRSPKASDFVPPQSQQKIVGLPAILPPPPKFMGKRDTQVAAPPNADPQ